MNCGNGTTLGPEGTFFLDSHICSGTPAGGTANANPSTICNGQTSVLNVSGSSTACGIVFKWQSAPPPGTVWTDIAGATSATYSATPATSTYYRRVTSCGANSANFFICSGTVLLLLLHSLLR